MKKIPKIVALSRQEVETSTAHIPCIIISVRSPGTRRAIVGSNDPKDVLFLEFNDIDKDGRIWTLHGSQVRDDVVQFNESMAKEVLDFVNKYKDEVELIICN